MPHDTFLISDTLDGARADQALAQLLGVSRTYAVEILEQAGASVRGRTLKKRDRVRSQDQLEVNWQPKREPSIEAVEVPDFSVRTITTISCRLKTSWRCCVSLACVGMVNSYGALTGAGFQIPPAVLRNGQGIVHRLDQGTSGLMVVAKSKYAYSE